MKTLALFLFALLSFSASASCKEVWIGSFVYTYHFEERSYDWNERNSGIDVRCVIDRVEVSVFSFRNSYDKQATGVSASYPLIRTTYIDAGLTGAVGSGYASPVYGAAYIQAKWDAVALRVFYMPNINKLAGATNAALPASSVVSLQLNFRVQ